MYKLRNICCPAFRANLLSTLTHLKALKMFNIKLVFFKHLFNDLSATKLNGKTFATKRAENRLTYPIVGKAHLTDKYLKKSLRFATFLFRYLKRRGI